MSFGGQHPFPMESTCGNITASYRLPAEARESYSQAVLQLGFQLEEDQNGTDELIFTTDELFHVDDFFPGSRLRLRPLSARGFGSRPFWLGNRRSARPPQSWRMTWSAIDSWARRVGEIGTCGKWSSRLWPQNLVHIGAIHDRKR